MSGIVAKSIRNYSSSQGAGETVVISGGGLIVTLESGATFNARWGEGDKITIDGEVRYVLSKDSTTQLTLQIATTKTGGGLSYTIERAYATPVAWEYAESGDLGAAQEIRKGVMYADGTYTGGVTFSNSTNTSASYYMWLTAAAGNRHDGTVNNGGVYISTSSITPAVTVYDDYTLVEYLMCSAGWADGSVYGMLIESGATGVKFNKCIVYSVAGTIVYGIYNHSYNQNFITNCQIYNISSDSGQSGIYDFGGSTYIYNCIVWNLATWNIGVSYGFYGGSVVKNCISMDAHSGGGSDFTGIATQAYNMSSDATASGTGSLTNKTASDQFLSVSGSIDLSPKSSADSIDAGIGPGSDGNVPSTDLKNNARSGSTCDMGSTEYVAIVTFLAAWAKNSNVLLNSGDNI